MKRNIFIFVMTVLLAIGLSACDKFEDATAKEASRVADQDNVYVNNQPAPSFDFSLERHMFTQLYMARNKAMATYSYVQNQYTGKILFSCPSIGYPIPANAQLTNPAKTVETIHGLTTLSQAEPNGLYTSPSTKGTYVMCSVGNGKVAPAYFEADVAVFATPMHEVNGQLMPINGAVPSITINTGR